MDGATNGRKAGLNLSGCVVENRKRISKKPTQYFTQTVHTIPHIYTTKFSYVDEMDRYCRSQTGRDQSRCRGIPLFSHSQSVSVDILSFFIINCWEIGLCQTSLIQNIKWENSKQNSIQKCFIQYLISVSESGL